MSGVAFLGLDLGTSSLKAVVLASDGHTVLGRSSATHPLTSPRPDWSETDPQDWWTAAVTAARQALALAGHPPVAAVGVDGQMHGHTIVDAHGRAVRDAILWSDGRAVALEERFAGLSADQRHRLANPFISGAAGATLGWLSEHEPEVLARARWSLSAKDMLRTFLVAETPVTDPSDASANLLWDVLADRWATDVMEALGVDPALMPEVRPSASVAGALTADAADALGLAGGVPVAVGAADAAAALVGTGMVRPGRVQLIVGTGAQALRLVDRPQADPTGRTHLYRSALPGQWYAMAAVQNAGLALDWVRRSLGVAWSDVYAAVTRGLPHARDPLFVPNLTRERPPQPAPGPGAAWVGLRLGHDRDTMLRAAAEGVAQGIRLAVDALPDTPEGQELLLVGGGGVDPGHRQLLADVLGRDLRSLDVGDASARGAALMAGVAAGRWPSVEASVEEADAGASAAGEPPPLVTRARPEIHAAYAERHARFLDVARAIG